MFIIPGSCVRLKVAGEVQQLFDVVLKPDIPSASSGRCMSWIIEYGSLTEHGDDDFSFSISGVGRFRCKRISSVTRCYGLRVVSLALPDPVKMHIPDEILRLAT